MAAGMIFDHEPRFAIQGIALLSSVSNSCFQFVQIKTRIYIFAELYKLHLFKTNIDIRHVLEPRPKVVPIRESKNLERYVSNTYCALVTFYFLKLSSRRGCVRVMIIVCD